MQIFSKQPYSDKQENSNSLMQTTFNYALKQIWNDNINSQFISV